MILGWAQGLVVLVLSVAALAGAVWGLIDAARFAAPTYVAAGKQTKALWLVLLGVAAVVAFASLPYPVGRGGGILGFLGIATIAVVAVYFASVRPALQQAQPRRGGRDLGGW